jgi:hypothetical protein
MTALLSLRPSTLSKEAHFHGLRDDLNVTKRWRLRVPLPLLTIHPADTANEHFVVSPRLTRELIKPDLPNLIVFILVRHTYRI